LVRLTRFGLLVFFGVPGASGGGVRFGVHCRCGGFGLGGYGLGGFGLGGYGLGGFGLGGYGRGIFRGWHGRQGAQPHV